MFIISVVIHLFVDLLPMIKKKGGYSCIDFFGLSRMNTRWSMVWLGLNIIIGSMILFLEVI